MPLVVRKETKENVAKKATTDTSVEYLAAMCHG